MQRNPQRRRIHPRRHLDIDPPGLAVGLDAFAEQLAADLDYGCSVVIR